MAAMQRAPLAGVGMSYSPIRVPSGAMWPILLAKFSVHHRLPSGADGDAAQGRVRRWKYEILKRAVAGEAAERIGAGFDKPDVAVGMGDHGARLAVVARDVEFGHRAVDGDAADTVAGRLAEPQRAVAHHDRQRLAAGRDATLEFRDFSVRRNTADLTRRRFPRTRHCHPARARCRLARRSAVGSVNSAKAPLEVMRPILLALFCANHRLPSPPSVMPIGVAPAVGSENSVNAALRGSKRPIFAVPLSQNHRLPIGSFDADVGRAVDARNTMFANTHFACRVPGQGRPFDID